MKRFIWPAVLIGFLFLGGTDSFGNRDRDMEPAKMFFLPRGNPDAGKKAFKDLQCMTCHNVAGAAEFSSGSGLGPELGPKQADYTAGWIANSIVSPSHTIALEAEDKGDEAPSLMGDFTEKMTVRQMIDLTAYIKSLGPEKTPASGEEENKVRG